MTTQAQLTVDFPEIAPADYLTVARAVGQGNELRVRGLMSLFEEPAERLQLLDQEPIASAIRDLRGKIGDPLWCYVEVRQRLLKAGIQSREMAIYLSNIWRGYRETGILPDLGSDSGQVMETVDILRELNFVKGYEKFELLAMSGNYYLFLMAFFEGYFRDLDQLSGKSAMAYYEAFARIAFRAARDHGLSEEFELWAVYDELCDRFADVRVALSGLVK
jgi:hypothetical protein